MKKFWLGAVRSLAIRTIVLAVVISIIHLWKFWAVPWLFGLTVVTVGLRFGVEYWAMRRMANKFEVDLELFARVRYGQNWDLLSIRLNEDAFRAELEKRRLT